MAGGSRDTEAAPAPDKASQSTAVAPPAPASSAAGTLGTALFGLQRAAGNAAVGRILASRTTSKPDPAPRSRVLQRRLRVRRPGANIPNPGGGGVVQTNAATIESYLQMLCAAGGVTVNAGSGEVAATAIGFCTGLPAGLTAPEDWVAETARTPAGCTCLCDMIGSAHTWTIVVDDAEWPHTSFDNDADAEVAGTGTGGEVTAPSPNSDKLWGAAAVSGATLDIPPWLVLGHELCGHAWLGDRGLHGPDWTQQRGQGGHQETVRRENLIRAEHSMELRGGFKDPHCGESFWRSRASPARINWSNARNVCIQWRRAYNRRHGTNYGIADRIP